MKYQLYFHPEAEKEYTEAYIWYEEKKERLGERFESMVEKRLNTISENPEPYDFSKGDYREVPIDIFPYTIVYKIKKQKKAVYISAIYHTSRNPRKKYRKA